jgi:DNA-binding MarR family transcriptional regulator
MKPLDNKTNTTQAFKMECVSLVMEVVPQIMKVIRSEIRSHRPSDLSVPQFRILNFIRRHPGASLSHLAEHMGLALPSASKMTDTLVQRGLVIREMSSKDRRRVTLSLTEEGASLIQSAREATRIRLANRLANLSDDDCRQVMQALEKIQPIFTPKDRDWKETE